MVFITVLYTTAKMQKPRSADGLMDREMWFIYTVENYCRKSCNVIWMDLEIHAIWMNFEEIMFGKISQSQMAVLHDHSPDLSDARTVITKC